MQRAWSPSDKRCTLSTKYYCHILHNVAKFRSVPICWRAECLFSINLGGTSGPVAGEDAAGKLVCSSPPENRARVTKGEKGPWTGRLVMVRVMSQPGWSLAVKVKPACPQARHGSQTRRKEIKYCRTHCLCRGRCTAKLSVAERTLGLPRPAEVPLKGAVAVLL